MRNFICLLAALIFFSCKKTDLAPQQQSSVAKVKKAAATTSPNIIFILGDDVGYEIPNYTGGESYVTPNLNKLARSGMQFTECHAAPMCSPSRVMMLSGKYNFRNYVEWGVYPIGDKTIANMLQDAGYTTGVYGKWQLDGGGTYITTMGFEHYTIATPFLKTSDESKPVSFYKNPFLYANNAYIPYNSTVGQYGEDIMRDSLFRFIDSNSNTGKPFFAWWSMNLPHKPFCPTPDDPDYATWNPFREPLLADSVYFPSMVKYMDKQIGMLLQKLQQSGLDENTVIIFAGDNGTDNLWSMYRGAPFKGKKGATIEAGTHVPLIVSWPGKIAAGSVNNDLIDFTDFMPTLAGIAKIPVPADYGTLDGVSFAPRLLGKPGTPREWIFCHYQPNRYEVVDNPVRWIQTKTYKQYDTTQTNQSEKVFDIVHDRDEKKPIPVVTMTPQQKAANRKAKAILNSLN